MKEKRINHRGHRGKINSLCSLKGVTLSGNEGSKSQPLVESVPKCRGSIYGTCGLDKSSSYNILWCKMQNEKIKLKIES